ncbi:isoaspartyl peptidase/L-asparaginase family protein [Bizionia sp. KMM 8389]
MKKPIYILMLFALLFNCKTKEELDAISNSNNPTPKDSTEVKVNDFAIVIHGGAGFMTKQNITPENEAAYKSKLTEAIQIGHNILKKGGTSIEAVEKTITILENSPLFNAGKGAVLTHSETHELDASIMDGKTLNAGASAGTTTVKNPISLARTIMENSPHVMLSGTGAEEFAEQQGLTLVNTEYFFTENNLKNLNRLKQKETNDLTNPADSLKLAHYNTTIKGLKFGTVGCVALDKNGNLAAGTSTGGMTNKRYGRIGDAPIIGAGTYANNNSCAISSTGWGEFFIRAVVAYDISALMQYNGFTLQEATHEVIQNKLADLGGNGGVIAIDKNGHIVTEFNTPGMFRASMNQQGELTLGIYENNEK